MKRFFVQTISDTPVLTGEEHKHLSVVLRARPGDEVVLSVGDGNDHVCRIESIGRDSTRLRREYTERNPGEPSVRVTLFMSVLKGDKNDLVVQKATELGVAEIVPVFTRYVQGHDRNLKIDRLNKIAHEAAKQCGRSVLTAVSEPVEFAEVLARVADFDTFVFPYERAERPSLKEFLSSHSVPRTAALLVGSEGGFAEEEAMAAIEKGICPVTLGKRILRAETANIAVLAAMMYAWEQWQ